METFWFFWLRFRRAYDSSYVSDFLFSLSHKRSYDSAYDFNSVSIVCENQPSDQVFCCGSVIFFPWFKFHFSLFLGMLNYMYNNEFETEKNEKHWIKDKNHNYSNYGYTKLGLNEFPQIFYFQLAVKIYSLYFTHLKVPFSSQQKQSFWDFKGYFGGINFQTHFDPTYLTPLDYKCQRPRQLFH